MKTTVLVVALVASVAACVVDADDDAIDVSGDGKTDSATTRISLSKEGSRTFMLSCSQDCTTRLFVQMVDRVLATRLTETPSTIEYLPNTTWVGHVAADVQPSACENAFGYGYDGKPAQYETCEPIRLHANTKVKIEITSVRDRIPTSVHTPDVIEYDVTLAPYR